MVKFPRQPPRWDRPRPGHPQALRGAQPPGPISIPRLAEGAEEQGNEATRCLCSTSSSRKDFSQPSYPGGAARSAFPALNALFRFTWSSASSPEPRALVHNLIATDHKAWLKEDSQALLTPSWVQNQAANQCALTKADNPALPQDPPTDPVPAGSRLQGPGAAPPRLLCSRGGLKSRHSPQAARRSLQHWVHEPWHPQGPSTALPLSCCHPPQAPRPSPGHGAPVAHPGHDHWQHWPG